MSPATVLDVVEFDTEPEAKGVESDMELMDADVDTDMRSVTDIRLPVELDVILDAGALAMN